MKNYFLACTACCMLWDISFAQLKTYLGAEGAFSNDIYEITDQGNELTTIPVTSGLWGFTIRQELNHYFSAETGLIKKYYDQGFGFGPAFPSGTSNAIDAWVIPLRMQAGLNLFREKVRLATIIGYAVCINSDYYGGGRGGGSMSYAGSTLEFDYTSRYNFQKIFSLLQTGIKLEFRIAKTALLSLSSSYYTGFKRVIQLDIDYEVNNSSNWGSLFSKGEMFSLGASLSYPVSNLWTKK